MAEKLKKFHVVALGCRTNQYEGQAFTDQLKTLGYVKAQKGEKADLCIVNTCTVTREADRSSLRTIRSLVREHGKENVVVTGCMADAFSKDHVQEEVRVVLNQDKERLIETLLPNEEEYPEFVIEQFEGKSRAFVKVQDGCNSFCTYCIIPYVRGRSRSRPMKEILDEVKRLIAQGYREVVLTGINVGDFDGGGTLADLVREVDQVEGLHALRISSIDPDEVDGSLSEVVLHGRVTCPSMHIVLQSGSNVVLKRMNRKYTKQIFLKTVDQLKSKCPDFTVTTDVIVGFPGETEADFQETCEVIEKVEFAKVHMFPYSPRERTRAALFPDPVSPDVIRQRKGYLLHLSEKVAYRLREKFLGRSFPVLLEEEREDGWRLGYTPNFLRVAVPPGPNGDKERFWVKLVENRPEGLVGVWER